MRWIAVYGGLLAATVVTGGCTARAIGDGSGVDEGADESVDTGADRTDSVGSESAGSDDTSTTSSTTSAGTSAGETGCLDGCGLPDLGDLGIDDSGINPSCAFNGFYDQGMTAVAGACTANEHCTSGVCEMYGDAPLQQGECVAQDPDCGTFMFGRVRNLVTGQPVPGATIKLADAIASIANPAGFTPLGQTTTDPVGEFTAVTMGPVVAPIELRAVVEGGSLARTVEWVMTDPNPDPYGPATPKHDLWAISKSDVDAWSAVLMSDPEIAAQAADWLPLQDNGGIVGVIIDADSGGPLAGHTVSNAQTPQAYEVRYLSESQNGFTTTETASNGIFIIFGAGASPTVFDVREAGVVVGSTQSGSAHETISIAVAAI